MLLYWNSGYCGRDTSRELFEAFGVSFLAYPIRRSNAGLWWAEALDYHSGIPSLQRTIYKLEEHVLTLVLHLIGRHRVCS